MNVSLPSLQVRLYSVAGGTRTIDQPDSNVAARVLTTLNPAKLFAAETVSISDGDVEYTFNPSGLVRVDLITEHLSVWDFPFVMGAHVELTGGEFREFIHPGLSSKSSGWQTDLPVFMKFIMNNGERYFFWMEVAGGLSAVRMSRIDSLLKGGHLIFGLRIGGVGVLNLAQVAQFSIYPEPPDAADEAETLGYQIERDELGLPEFLLRPSEDEAPQLIGASLRRRAS